MKFFLIRFYSFMFLFVPIPLFFDFSSFSFLYENVTTYSPLLSRPGIPLPIGGIALFLAIIAGFLSSIIYPKRFKSMFTVAQLLKFLFFVLVPLSLYGLFIAELKITRLIQLILPVTFLTLLSFPILLKDRIVLLRNLFLGAFLFFTMHFLSIIFNSNDILNVDIAYEFSSFFGVLIYQSLVSYPGVLSLYFLLSIAIIYIIRSNRFSIFRYGNILVYIFPFILMYLLAASGRRAFLVELVSALVVFSVLSLIFIFKNKIISKKSSYFYLLFISLFLAFFAFYLNTSLSDRVVMSVRENTFDSGRINILGMAYDFFANNLMILFFGGGQREVPGFHNYIFDQMYRVGLVGMVFLYTVMAILIRRFIRYNDIYVSYKYARIVFISVLASSFFWQSMINASISQPYYFVNFLIVNTVVFFVVFTNFKAETSRS